MFFEKLLEKKPQDIQAKGKSMSSEHPLKQQARIVVETVKKILIQNRIKENTKDIAVEDETKEIPTTAKTPLKTVTKTPKGKVPKSAKKTLKRAK